MDYAKYCSDNLMAINDNDNRVRLATDGLFRGKDDELNQLQSSLKNNVLCFVKCVWDRIN